MMEKWNDGKRCYELQVAGLSRHRVKGVGCRVLGVDNALISQLQVTTGYD